MRSDEGMVADFEPIELDLSECFIIGNIPCGPGELDLNDGVLTPLAEELSRPPERLKFVRAKGKSMMGFRIHPNDIIIYEEGTEARNGEIVVVSITGRGYTVKKLVDGKLVANHGRKPIFFDLNADTKIIGPMRGQVIPRSE
jgi:SOS-response transcriptional repressor LexA